ncbi:MAG: hypothetical protein WBO10_15065 [Pyrinomonadaceae bacterium]
MSSTKHSQTAADLSKAYEENEIGLKGIFSFGVGLLLLIVITFGLMWAFLKLLEGYWEETADAKNPMVMNDRERLPPEPRLQAAPGFGVDSEKGWVNMELVEPQAEYRELHKQWIQIWENGLRDGKTGAVTMMSVDEAKEALLRQGVKAKSGSDAEAVVAASRLSITDSSAGRLASLARR